MADQITLKDTFRMAATIAAAITLAKLGEAIVPQLLFGYTSADIGRAADAVINASFSFLNTALFVGTGYWLASQWEAVRGARSSDESTVKQSPAPKP